MKRYPFSASEYLGWIDILQKFKTFPPEAQAEVIAGMRAANSRLAPIADALEHIKNTDQKETA